MRECGEPRGGHSRRQESHLLKRCGLEFRRLSWALRITPLCTLVGAIPGAASALIGWSAAPGRLDPEAWALWAIVALWQFSHFMAIAWMYRDDYARARYAVLPSGEWRGRFVTWHTFAASLALVAAVLLPTIAGGSGLVSFVGILAVGATFLYYSGRFGFQRSNVTARQLLVASIIYLPVIFVLIMVNAK
jgi:heme o synthase